MIENFKVASRIFLALALTFPSVAGSKRSQSAKVEFKQHNPCPATGARNGPCKGHVIDHVMPLACGGLDSPGNMQWQTTEEAKAKDKWERKGCAK